VDESQLLGTKIKKCLKMESSANLFKNAIDKAYTTQPNVKLNTDTISDALKYKKGFTEEVEDDDFEYETFLDKRLKQSAKDQFKKDLQQDKDFAEFKKNTKFDKYYTFGTPNVSDEDPFIEKPKYGRVGKTKKGENKEATSSGSSGAFSGPIAFKDSDFVKRSFKETPKLKESDVEKVEATEATGSGSVGGYESPAMWAKSTSKKDWGPSRKTQYKGGSFVKVKKKCTKFPYCNQGDINALKLSKNESIKEAIDNVAKKLGVNKNIIMNILEHEYKKLNKRTK
jgi:hypothetical protein